MAGVSRLNQRRRRRRHRQQEPAIQRHRHRAERRPAVCRRARRPVSLLPVRQAVVFLERRHLDQGRARRRLPLGRPAFEPPGRRSKRRNPQEPGPGGVRERCREVRPARSETGHDCGRLEQRPDVAGNAGRNGGLANGRASDEPARGLHHENDRAWRRSTSLVRAGSSS